MGEGRRRRKIDVIIFYLTVFFFNLKARKWESRILTDQCVSLCAFLQLLNSADP